CLCISPKKMSLPFAIRFSATTLWAESGLAEHFSRIPLVALMIPSACCSTVTATSGMCWSSSEHWRELRSTAIEFNGWRTEKDQMARISTQFKSPKSFYDLFKDRMKMPETTTTLVTPTNGVLPVGNLKNVDNWRAFIHQLIPVIVTILVTANVVTENRSEERRVGKEMRDW